jgi:hypothetical protein
MNSIIPRRAKEEILDALLDICSIHIGFKSQVFNFFPALRMVFKIPRSKSLNKCPPSNGTIGIRFVKPRRIFTHISQKKRLVKNSKPDLPMIAAKPSSSA